MKRRIWTLILVLALTLGLAVPAMAADRGTLTYKEVIAPQYEDAGAFDEGLAPVKKGGKWGYIDTTGRVVVPFQYDIAHGFSEGLAVVATISKGEEDGAYIRQFGTVDTSGKYTPLPLTENVYLDTEEELAEFLAASAGGQFHNGYVYMQHLAFIDGVYDHTGKEISCEDCVPTGPVNEGLIPIQDQSDPMITAGWMDTSGRLVKKFSPDDSIVWVDSFNQGLAVVKQYTVVNGTDTWLCGIMDRNFQWVVRPQYGDWWTVGYDTDRITFGETGLAMVWKDGKWGAIDKSGRTVIPFQYENLQPAAEGMIPYRLGGKWGYLDAGTLKPVISARYQEASGFHNGLAAVYDGSKAFLINRRGQQVPGSDVLDPDTYFTHDGENLYLRSPDTYVVIEKNGKYGFGKIDYTQPLPDKSEMSSWAYDNVVAAIEEDLVPGELQNLYRRNITRGEFCDLVIQTVCSIEGKEVETLVKEKTGKSLASLLQTVPFQDTNDKNVVAANALGIVAGRSANKFDPYATITRQEAAALLMRAAKFLGVEADGKGATFADQSAIANWSREAVDFVSAIQVMSGTSGGKFSPLGTYTREQSYATVHRLLEAEAG